jgi:hypothetical protein
MSSAKYLPWPRLRLTVARAHELLLSLDPDGSRYGLFPINMDEVARKLNMRFVPGETVQRLVGGGPVDLATCLELAVTTVAIIPVNTSAARLLFTCGHEAAHKALGHFKEFDVPWLKTFAGISRPAAHTLDALDREADVFATELLMPLAVVRHLDLSVEDLEYYHCVSHRAAQGRRRDLEDPRWLELTRYDEKPILAHCAEYINDILALRAMFDDGREG